MTRFLKPESGECRMSSDMRHEKTIVFEERISVLRLDERVIRMPSRIRPAGEYLILRTFPKRCPPLVPPVPRGGTGRSAMPLHYRKDSHESSVQVIQCHRNRGMPTRLGVNRRISEDLLEKNSSEFFDCISPQERQTSLFERVKSIASRETGNSLKYGSGSIGSANNTGIVVPEALP